jgi:hypothetical protein
LLERRHQCLPAKAKLTVRNLFGAFENLIFEFVSDFGFFSAAFLRRKEKSTKMYKIMQNEPNFQNTKNACKYRYDNN